MAVSAQNITPYTTEEKLETLAEAEDNGQEDDSYLQQLSVFRNEPLNLNLADGTELNELKILNEMQVENFLNYRVIFGKLISIYELQAVPGWDIVTIRKILPYITIANPVTTSNDLKNRMRKGEHSFLLRYAEVLGKAKGFNPSNTSYFEGSRGHLFFRYRYHYKNIFQYGIVGDKDEGEQFFKGKEKIGFDFYSFHLFIRKLGSIHSLAIGDFTVNMGQGLIQWQSLGFKKTADVLGIKRQSTVLRPYNSAGEFYFQRGIGVTIKKRNVETTAFVSAKRLSANLFTDSFNGQFVSSFITSGFHRTWNELNNKNNLGQIFFGGNIKYAGANWQMGINGVYYHFSIPIRKQNEPYNLFSVNGRNWSNLSVDYSFTWRNIHFFGESATDKNRHTAFLNGLLLSADPRVDLSFIHRAISKKFQSINGNAFTENSYPSNETGWYSGISIKPISSWRINAYVDIFKFPWLSFLSDAPGYGKDFLLQVDYVPNKQTEILFRYRNESKQRNGIVFTTHNIILIPRKSLRTQVNFQFNRNLSLRNRVELVWYDKKPDVSFGYLGFIEIFFRRMIKGFSGNLRIQYFETDDYNARVYAYQQDVLYSFSIPSFYDKGFFYYFNFNYKIGKKISFWFKWSQIIYRNKTVVGSALDEIPGNKKTELKFQVLWDISK